MRPTIVGTRRRRTVVGWMRLGGWGALLYAFASPWRDLGGVVDERLRWLEWAALSAALPVGFTAGLFARDRSTARPRSDRARAVAAWLLPPAVAVAAALLWLEARGAGADVSLVATSALLSGAAGFDAAFGALPLMGEGAPPPAPRRGAPLGDGGRRPCASPPRPVPRPSARAQPSAEKGHRTPGK